MACLHTAAPLLIFVSMGVSMRLRLPPIASYLPRPVQMPRSSRRLRRRSLRLHRRQKPSSASPPRRCALPPPTPSFRATTRQQWPSWPSTIFQLSTCTPPSSRSAALLQTRRALARAPVSARTARRTTGWDIAGLRPTPLSLQFVPPSEQANHKTVQSAGFVWGSPAHNDYTGLLDGWSIDGVMHLRARVDLNPICLWGLTARSVMCVGCVWSVAAWFNTGKTGKSHCWRAHVCVELTLAFWPCWCVCVFKSFRRLSSVDVDGYLRSGCVFQKKFVNGVCHAVCPSENLLDLEYAGFAEFAIRSLAVCCIQPLPKRMEV